MTECTRKPAEEFLESYLLGTLPEDEAQRFEEHYFDCPACLSQVEALQAASRQLHLAPRRGFRPTLSWPYRLAGLGAIAALLLIGFVVLHGKRPPQPTMAHSPVTAPPAEQAPSKPAGPASLAVSRLHAARREPGSPLHCRNEGLRTERLRARGDCALSGAGRGSGFARFALLQRRVPDASGRPFRSFQSTAGPGRCR